ncbi:MAG: VCBS repeat-containing protein [Verrucomicrobia bacterium]|nr:VCBS repeat-containing protein [Verrucomicrobiota bacterium]
MAVPTHIHAELSRARRFVGVKALVSLSAVMFSGLAMVAAELSWEPVSGGRRAALSVSANGKVGFSPVENVRAGIGFVNSIDDRLIMENNNFMEGSGVALGDFDGDGWCDVYFCAISGTNRLYRNLGSWKFEDVTAKAGVEGANWNSTGATFADVDGDGDLDLLVNTLGRGTHSFENLGGGKFRETTIAAGLASKTGSLGMALGDVDGDGDLDLYVANYGTLAIMRAGGRAEMKMVNGKWELSGPHADRLRMVNGRLEEVGEPDVLYLNDGRGRFTPVPWNSENFLDYEGKPLATPWDFGLGVQIRDINEDGHPDIYVCNDFQTVDRVWINDGRGRFRLLSKQAMRQQSFAAMGVDFADIDRDGDLDFFVVEMLSRDVSRRLRQIGGAQVSFPTPGWSENRPEVMRNTLFCNRGDGTYAEVAYFAGVEASDWSWQPVFLDVDLDGYEDILVANGNAFDVQDRDTLRRVRAIGKQTPEQTRTNILLYPRFNSPNVAFRNRGDLTFEETGQAWGFDSRQISHGVALADLDRDGDLDVVVNCLYSAPLLYRNESSVARVAVRLKGASNNVQGIGAKVKLLGGAVPVQSQEMVSGGRYLAGDDPIRVFAANRAAVAMNLEVVWRNGRRSVLTNVQANQLYEVDELAASIPVKVPAPATNSPLFLDVSERIRHTHREEIFDDYARQPLLAKQMSSLGPGVAWFDLDGDGHEDLFVGTGKGGRIGVFRGDGKGGFADMTPGDLPPMPDDVTGLAGFVWADGSRALLAGVANYENADHGSAVWSLRLDAASGRLTNSPVAAVSGAESSTGPLAVTDFDADGDLDLFVGGRVLPGKYPLPASSRLYRQESGKLVLDLACEPLLSQVGLVSGAAWSDLDGDGFPELILACEWGPVKIFRNLRGRLVAWNPEVRSGAKSSVKRSLMEWTGWWSSVATGDFDGDGRMDIVAGNWGLNSNQRADFERPARLYFGDIGGRGAVDLVETEFSAELGGYIPRRSLATLSQAAPRLNELHPSHASYSTARLPEMLKPLGASVSKLNASTLVTTVFLNRGEFMEAVPLPREVQLAPVFGMSVADFDGDGRQDIFFGQNFFALRPEVSRLDAGCGLVVIGDGRGGFRATAPSESGTFLLGEVRGVAAGDFNEDGRSDLVVGQNGTSTRALLNNRTGPGGLRVRVWAGAGNPFGFGAAVVDAAGVAQEIVAGGGYWSQGGAVVTIPNPDSKPISIRWPGGRTNSYQVAPGSSEVLIRMDSGISRTR